MREKIIALFEYRQLPDLMMFNKKDWDQDFYELLIELQYHIYKLDHELETNWEVDLSIIKNRWKEIYAALLKLGVPEELHDNYCRHIYKYQKHELDIRQQKLPTRLSMEYFYFYKSCDVKLLRKLIYEFNPSLSKSIKQSQWRLFDLVTEINDDIDDLQEDIHTINGNRFLISLKQFGEEKTRKIFTEFLNDVNARNDATPITFGALDLHEWTRKNVKVTLQLMESKLLLFRQLDTKLYDQVVYNTVESS